MGLSQGESRTGNLFTRPSVLILLCRGRLNSTAACWVCLLWNPLTTTLNLFGRVVTGQFAAAVVLRPTTKQDVCQPAPCRRLNLRILTEG